MITYDATYSPEDNKIRLRASARLDAETYARVKAAGFSWAPKQELFVAPMWTPSRADLAEELAGEIGDEDTSLVDRAEERAERFEDYSDKRERDALAAKAAVDRIADGIPFGQPILVGHHSEKHARKDAERIESGMRKAVKMWETSAYWEQRAKGAIRHAKYKERPDVRARRIKKIEADKRKQERETAQATKFLTAWQRVPITLERAKQIANFDHMRDPTGKDSVWGALERGTLTPEAAQAHAIDLHERGNAWRARWIAHYDLRIAYERAMLEDAGGTVADKTGPQVGGAVRCWASPGHGRGWSWIRKVNKVSVTIGDNWGNGGQNFTRTIPFDKLGGVVTPEYVAQARADGRIAECDDKTGFYLAEAPEKARTPTAPKPEAAAFDAMKQSLRTGVKVVSAPQLFPTPRALAIRMLDGADLRAEHSFLEPSAGTGVIVMLSGALDCTAVEINPMLANGLRNISGVKVACADFLTWEPGREFDRIVMNPPFGQGADIKHIQHAIGLLKPGGRLVALCAAGPRQKAALAHMGVWEDLPPGSFESQGTGVNVAMLTVDAPEAPKDRDREEAERDLFAALEAMENGADADADDRINAAQARLAA